MKNTYKKGDTVYYDNHTLTFRARVMTAHRDGTITVSPQFAIDADGNDKVGYYGDLKYRVDMNSVRTRPRI